MLSKRMGSRIQPPDPDEDDPECIVGMEHQDSGAQHIRIRGFREIWF